MSLISRLSSRFGVVWERILRLRLRWILLFGLVVRLVLMPLASETYDVSVWYLLSNDVLKGFGVYSSHTYTYPPLWAYTFLPLIRILALLVSPTTFGITPDNLASQGIRPGTLQPVVSPLFLTFLKLPLLLVDLGVSYLIYRITIGFAGWSRGKAALTLWLLSPSIIWTSFGHGQFDLIPAALTLVSSYLLYRKQMLSSGFALSLAVLYKLYPVFFVPLYLTAILVSRVDGAGWRNHLARFLTGLIVPGVIFALLPLWLPPSGGSFIDSLFARGGLLSSFGGFSPFGIVNLAQFYSTRQWLILNSGLVNDVVLASQFALSIVIAWRMRRQLVSDRFPAIISGQVFMLVILFLTSPLTNPQYVVWILPFLTLLYGTKGTYFKRSWILSTTSFLFNLLWLGPGYFLYPLAMYFGTPSVASLTAINSFFVANSIPAITVCQLAGFGAMLSSLKPNLSGILSAPRTNLSSKPSHEEVSLNLKLPQRMKITLILGVIFLVASLGFIAVNASLSITLAPKLTVTDYSITHNSTYLHAQANLHLKGGTYPAEIDSLFLPLRTMPHQSPVFIYYDPEYPTSLSDIRGWKGLTDHLPIELQQRDYPSNVTLVNAKGLAALLASNQRDVVIVPSGVLPNTTNVTALKSFMQTGGTVFWLSDRIGYYVTGSALVLNRTSSLNPRYNAQKLLFNGVIVQENASSLDYSIAQRFGPYVAATVGTHLSRSLGLNYPETTVGIDLTNLTRVGGMALGKVNLQTNQTSIAEIPIGLGRLVLFGGGVSSQFASSGEVTIASDIAQILGGNILDSSFEVASLQVTLAATESVNATLDLSLQTSESIVGILFVAYSPNPDISFFEQTVYPPP